jgi:hypothetical protein
LKRKILKRGKRQREGKEGDEEWRDGETRDKGNG